MDSFIDGTTLKPTFANSLASQAFGTNPNTGRQMVLLLLIDDPNQEYIVKADDASNTSAFGKLLM